MDFLHNLTRRQLIGLATLLLLLVAIPLTFYLIRQQQIFRSRADFVPALSFTGRNVNPAGTVATARDVSLLLSYAITTPTPTPTPPAPTFKRVFVTSQTYNGDLKTAGSAKGLGTASDGLDGADKICQSHANAASLGGTWKAWLSRYQVSSASRINPGGNSSLGPFKLLDGRTVANNWTELIDGSIDNPINFTETRSTITRESPNIAVWTHTLSNGSPQFIQTIGSPFPPFQTACATSVLSPTSAWSDNSQNISAGIGSAISFEDGQWTNIQVAGFIFIGCNSEARLYCFEVGTAGTPQERTGGATPTPTPIRAPNSVACTGGAINCESCVNNVGTTCGGTNPTKICYTTTGSANCYSVGVRISCTLPACPTPIPR